MIIYVAYVFLALVVGFLGRKTYLGFWANFIFSLFFTPVPPLIYILIAGYRDKTKQQAAAKEV